METDSSAGEDTGIAADAAMMPDSETPSDAATVATRDSGGDAGSADGGADETVTAGCGCRTAKPTPTSTPAFAGFGVLSVVLLGARRRTRARRVGRPAAAVPSRTSGASPPRRPSEASPSALA
jgi:MYXO-CTERM domain-containing protein